MNRTTIGLYLERSIQKKCNLKILSVAIIQENIFEEKFYEFF